MASLEPAENGWDLQKSEPIKPSKVAEVSPLTPNPPTAATPTTPEDPQTLQIQLFQLSIGLRKVVMFCQGSAAPYTYPSGSRTTSDQFGNVFVFRPDLITATEIKKASKNNELPGILGSATHGMGTVDKSFLAPNASNVIVRTAEGLEVQSAAADEQHLQSAIEAAHQVRPEGGYVHVEPPAVVISQRNGQQASLPAPRALRKPQGPWDLIKSEPLPKFAFNFANKIAMPAPVPASVVNPNLPSEAGIQKGGGPKKNLQSNAGGVLPTPPVGVPGGPEPPEPPPRGASAEMFRGSWNIPLNDEGRADAQKVAAVTAGKFNQIQASTLGRAQETAHAVAATNPQAGPVQSTDALRPMHLGALEGQPVTPDAIKAMNQHILTQPTVPFPGASPMSGEPGESFDNFRQRVLGHVLAEVQGYEPGERRLNVTHYRDIQLIKAWLKAGGDAEGHVDMKEMTTKGDQKPGQLYRLEDGKLDHVEDAEQPGIYFLRHGETQANEGASAEAKTPERGGQITLHLLGTLETIARLMDGRHAELGLNQEQARSLAAHHVREIKKQYGNTKPADAAKHVFDALRTARQQQSTGPDQRSARHPASKSNSPASGPPVGGSNARAEQPPERTDSPPSRRRSGPSATSRQNVPQTAWPEKTTAGATSPPNGVVPGDRASLGSASAKVVTTASRSRTPEVIKDIGFKARKALEKAVFHKNEGQIRNVIKHALKNGTLTMAEIREIRGTPYLGGLKAMSQRRNSAPRSVTQDFGEPPGLY